MNIGDILYTIDGRQVSYIAEVPGVGHCVRFVYDDGEDRIVDELTAVITDRVFAEPPTAIYDARIAHLQNNIVNRQTQLGQITSDILRAQQTMQELQKHAQLSRLSDFLDGKITHFVCRWNKETAPDLMTFDEAMSQRDSRWEKKLKLLVLYGDSNGDLEWRTSEYHDGSGTQAIAEPFCSYEEALERCNVLFDEIWQAYEKDHKHCYQAFNAVGCADALQIDVPALVREAAELDRLAKLKAQIATKRAELDNLEAQVGEA